MPDPQMKAVLDQLAELGGKPIAKLTAQQARKQPTPADAVNLVLYLLEGTDFTTGNIYRIDGGRFLGSDS